MNLKMPCPFEEIEQKYFENPFDIMEQQIALVTGSNRGIGYATVQVLLEKGYKVILTARKKEDGLKAHSQLASYGELEFRTLDVGNTESVRKLATSIREKHGRLDILINNAGINYDTWHTASEADLDQV